MSDMTVPRNSYIRFVTKLIILHVYTPSQHNYHIQPTSKVLSSLFSVFLSLATRRQNDFVLTNVN